MIVCRIYSRLISRAGRCAFLSGFCSMMFGLIAGVIADIFFFTKGEKNVTFAEEVQNIDNIDKI